MGRTGLAHGSMERFLDLGRIHFQGLGQAFPLRIVLALEDDFRKIGDLEPALLQETADGLGNEFAEPRIPDPAVFPLAIERGFGPADVVHEIRGQGIRPLEFGDDVLTADDEGCAAVSEDHLLGAAHPAQTAVRGRDQNLGDASRSHGFQGGKQGRGPRFQGAGKIRRAQVFPQVQGRGHDARVLPL